MKDKLAVITQSIVQVVSIKSYMQWRIKEMKYSFATRLTQMTMVTFLEVAIKVANSFIQEVSK